MKLYADLFVFDKDGTFIDRKKLASYPCTDDCFLEVKEEMKVIDLGNGLVKMANGSKTTPEAIDLFMKTRNCVDIPLLAEIKKTFKPNATNLIRGEGMKPPGAIR